MRRSLEIRRAIQRVLQSGWYVGGAEVGNFELEFARFIGAKHAVSVASGTDALLIALRACGVGPGDRVATVSLTAVATVAAIELAGATPVFVDIDPRRFTMDPDRLEHLLRRSPVKAIVPVHLYGQPADMERITTFASRHGAKIVEDCAQAHGADFAGRLCGTWGSVAAFSFYPTKNLGAIGDGGAVVTSDLRIADRVRLLREYGWKDRYISEIPGMNSRLDPIQAAFLRVKLRSLRRDNARRRRIARCYSEALAHSGIVPPACAEGVTHIYHQYVVRTPQRDKLRTHLALHGIQTAVHYPQPVHLQPAYCGRIPVVDGELRHTERACEEILSLPCFPELTDREVARVISALRSFRP